MNREAIEQQLKATVAQQIGLFPAGKDRFRVMTPFQFHDRDHLVIVLKKGERGWLVSDEGHTFMHLSYELDEKSVQGGTRAKLIEAAVNAFGIEDHGGVLQRAVEGEGYGEALCDLVQCILRINDVTYLNRDRVRSVFLEDFRRTIESAVPPERRSFNWSDGNRDPKGRYVVDCRINNMTRPLMVFALGSDSRVRDATITLLQFEKWGIPFSSLGIFEDQEEISRPVLARFTNVCERQYSGIKENGERIRRHIELAIQ